MNLLESLPTVIGTAAVAPALLLLWLVIAADEHPGPPAKVWTAFLLDAASISLLGVVRAPFASILAAPENHWVARAFRRSDGHRGLWRGGGARLCGLRKPRLSRAACGDVAIAGRIAQHPDRAVQWCARHHRRRLSGDGA